VQDQSNKQNEKTKLYFNEDLFYLKFTSERETITRISVESFVPIPLTAL
jgi:hypothetical protein